MILSILEAEYDHVKALLEINLMGNYFSLANKLSLYFKTCKTNLINTTGYINFPYVFMIFLYGIRIIFLTGDLLLSNVHLVLPDRFASPMFNFL